MLYLVLNLYAESGVIDHISTLHTAAAAETFPSRRGRKQSLEILLEVTVVGILLAFPRTAGVANAVHAVSLSAAAHA